MSHEQNNLAIVLIIAGFTLPGLEIVSNALKLLANGQLSSSGASLTIIGGLLYTIFSLPLITARPSSTATNTTTDRFLRIMPLILGLILLLAVKFISINTMLENGNLINPSAWNLFLAETIPGLGKRLILLFGLAQDPANSAISRALNPFFKIESSSTTKNKKD